MNLLAASLWERDAAILRHVPELGNERAKRLVRFVTILSRVINPRDLDGRDTGVTPAGCPTSLAVSTFSPAVLENSRRLYQCR